MRRPASAAPDPALEPLAFLAGHCWIGTPPGTADTDEDCFAWWTRSGDDAYEVLREYETDKERMPVKMPMKKVARP